MREKESEGGWEEGESKRKEREILGKTVEREREGGVRNWDRE